LLHWQEGKVLDALLPRKGGLANNIERESIGWQGVWTDNIDA
jgi:hypothetical protein